MILRAFPNSVRWYAGALVVAAAVGMLSSVDPKYAILIAVAIGGLALFGLHESFVLPALAASVFIEVINIGGIPISRLLAALGLFVVAMVLSRERVRLGTSQPLPWVVGYSVWALASASWTASLNGTIFQLSSLTVALIYLTSFAVLVRSERDLFRVLVAVAVTSLLVGLYAVATFLTGAGGDLDQGRTAGGAGDPNFFATYQIVALPLTLVLAATVRERRHRFWLYGVTLVIVASVLTSLSRGGLLTLITVLLLIAAVPARRLYDSPGQKGLFLAVIVASGIFAVATTAKELVPRIEAIVVNKQETTAAGRGSGRVDLWLAARSAFVAHPYGGIGYGAFPSQAPQLLLHTPGVDLSTFDLTTIGDSEVHNAYLSTLAELGIPGFLFFGGILFSLGASLLRTARLARRAGNELVGRVATGLVIGLVGWAIASIFLSTETSHALWIMLGMSLALPRLISTRDEAGSARSTLLE